MIAERQHAISHDLSGLVTLAGDQKHIALFQPGDGVPDRLRTIADFLRAARGCEDRRADHLRIFAARIVVGNDDVVGILGGDRAHQRALAGIAVAAGAEHDDKSSLRIGPQGLQRFRQRVRLVRVIDENRRSLIFADALQPSLRAFEMFERGEDLFRLAAGADRKTGCDNRVLDLEFADQRQMNGITAPAMLKLEPLREALDGACGDANALACAIAVAADRDQPQFPFRSGLDHGLRAIMIGRDHRSAVRDDEIAKQPKFCAKIMRDVRMVIHVVARQIGEGARTDTHTIKPILIEPVR